MRLLDSHPSNPTATGGTPTETPFRDVMTGAQSLELSILGGLILLQVILVWA